MRSTKAHRCTPPCCCIFIRHAAPYALSAIYFCTCRPRPVAERWRALARRCGVFYQPHRESRTVQKHIKDIFIFKLTSLFYTTLCIYIKKFFSRFLQFYVCMPSISISSASADLHKASSARADLHKASSASADLHKASSASAVMCTLLCCVHECISLSMYGFRCYLQPDCHMTVT